MSFLTGNIYYKYISYALLFYLPIYLECCCMSVFLNSDFCCGSCELCPHECVPQMVHQWINEALQSGSVIKSRLAQPCRYSLVCDSCITLGFCWEPPPARTLSVDMFPHLETPSLYNCWLNKLLSLINYPVCGVQT